MLPHSTICYQYAQSRKKKTLYFALRTFFSPPYDAYSYSSVNIKWYETNNFLYHIFSVPIEIISPSIKVVGERFLFSLFQTN